MPPEPHRVVFGQVHGVLYTFMRSVTGLVWQFCTLLKWPTKESSRVAHDSGISWVELAVSFMRWSGRYLPVEIREGNTWTADSPSMTPKCKMLPKAAFIAHCCRIFSMDG